MLKKSEVLEILDNGGHITINEIYRTAYVYHADNSDTAGRVRYDVAERIEKDGDHITQRGEAWSFTRRIYKTPAHYWEELSATVEAAAQEDAASTQDIWTPAPELVAVRDPETEEIMEGNPRAIYYALHHRARWQRREGEHVTTWEALNPAAIAVIAAAEAATQAAEEIAPAEEAEPLPMKIYVRADGEGTTFHASEARTWHASGLDLIIHSRYGKTGVYVHGRRQEPKHRSEDENRAHCKHIADELDAYVRGDLRRCPDCGEEIRRDWDEVGDVFKCPHCGEVSDPYDWEQLSVWDFLGDCYDIEYRCTSRQELRSVCVMVACGGPNIYIDTASKDVELYWWSERARYPLSCEAVEAVDEWAEEMWGCC